MRWIAGCFAAVLGLAVLSPARAETVVCAPGAMSDVMTAIAELAARQGVPFKPVIGHSPGQAKQIVDGAPCDVFIRPIRNGWISSKTRACWPSPAR